MTVDDFALDLVKSVTPDGHLWVGSGRPNAVIRMDSGDSRQCSSKRWMRGCRDILEPISETRIDPILRDQFEVILRTDPTHANFPNAFRRIIHEVWTLSRELLC